MTWLWQARYTLHVWELQRGPAHRPFVLLTYIFFSYEDQW